MGQQAVIARAARAFVLLEVMIAIMIVAIAFVALMKGFVISLDRLNRIRSEEQALYLARSMMDDLQLNPPPAKTFEGKFSDDSRYGDEFAGWRYKLEVESEEPDYDERPIGKINQDLEEVYYVHLEVSKGEDDRSRDSRTILNLYTILMEADIYSTKALQANQLF